MLVSNLMLHATVRLFNFVRLIVGELRPPGIYRIPLALVTYIPRLIRAILRSFQISQLIFQCLLSLIWRVQ